MFDLFGKKTLVGVDVGHHSVKVALLGDGKKDAHVLEQEIMPRRETRDEDVPPQAVIEALKGAVAQCQASRPRARLSYATSFQAEGMLGFYLELPRLKKEELETAARSATVRQIPFSVDDAFISTTTVPPLSGDSQKHGMFVTAFRKALIEQHTGLFRQAGLAPENVELFFSPMLRSLSADRGAPTPNGAFVAVVLSGSRLTTVAILRDGNPYYLRDFPIGGRDFTYAIQMGAQTTWQDAEARKRLYDATSRDVPVEPILLRWIDQVRRSMEAFLRQHRALAPTLSRVLLTGGSAGLRGLDARLAEVIRLPVLVDSWAHLQPDPCCAGKPAGCFRVATGLCL